jgi:hypothetical protein
MAGTKIDKMTARQDKALAALLTASSITEAAKASGLRCGRCFGISVILNSAEPTEMREPIWSDRRSPRYSE